MEEELTQLKKVLRSLVVSSPSTVDMRSLMRDYRDMMGEKIPLSKFGCRDPVSFLKTYFKDCFLFQGPESNPILTLIVPDSLKHIDKFVQKQKSSHHVKLKGKRRSINESILNKSLPKENLITKSFQTTYANKVQHDVEKKSPEIYNRQIEHKVENKISLDDRNKIRSDFDDSLKYKDNLENKRDTQYRNDSDKSKSPYVRESESSIKEDIPEYDKKHTEKVTEKGNINCNELKTTSDREKAANNNSNYNAYQSFVKKRMPLYNIDHADGTECSDKDSFSDRPLSSSTSSSKRQQLEELQRELTEIILEDPDGVWCTHLLRKYRNRYGRELNFNKFGFTSVLSMAYTLEQCAIRQIGDDWLLQDARAPPPRHVRPAPSRAFRPRTPTDPEDALPFTDFDPDVFPADCLHFMESIPGPQLEDVEAGSMLEVIVGEVYSPSHFWMIRLGQHHNLAMEAIMDQMNEYYKRGKGRERRLALGAARPGHYCSSCYLGDWHRSLIVKVIDSDTVKVRHVDYGTVEPVSVRELRPLRRKWAALPAQAVRARLAAVRPPAAGRRWPRAAAVRFLAAVSDRGFVANVVARDPRDDVLEVLLIDTSTDVDVNVGDELVRAGHAERTARAATGVSRARTSVGLLLHTILGYDAAPPTGDRDDDDEDDDSDVSASASQVAGRARRLRTWSATRDTSPPSTVVQSSAAPLAVGSSPECASVVSASSTVHSLALRLRLRGTDRARSPERPPEPEPEAEAEARLRCARACPPLGPGGALQRRLSHYMSTRPEM